jgi:hypothetical protein
MATLLEYFAHAQPRKLGSRLVWISKPEGGVITQWVSDGKGNVTWIAADGDVGDTEHWRVRNGWIMVDGFSSDWGNGTPAYGGTILRAEIEDIASGAWCELPPSPAVHYYSPYLLPAHPWRMRNWARVDGTILMYWETDLYPGVRAENPVWYEGKQTREVIRQQEVWWDANGGWVRGSGSPPFDAAGKPIRPTVTKMYEVTIARDIGLWTGKDLATGGAYGAYSVWQWG